MNNEIEKLMVIIRDLANKYFPKEYKSIEEALCAARNITKASWKEHHFEIISELTNLNRILNRDYQRFWFDCLRFPPAWPEMRDLRGKLYYEDYSGLPSDFNEIYYHDSTIHEVESGNYLSLYIDLVEDWEDEQHGWIQQGRKAILTFEDIVDIRIDDYLEEVRTYKESQLTLKDLRGATIYSITEVPCIDYICKEVSLDINLVRGKRVFILDTLIDDYNRVIIVCNSWSINRYGERHKVGFAYKVNV